ncbi:MAG: TIGR04282 family arsenosugar biosynthesis glycosyltransferase [Candidatus Dormibacteria bacterium]
MTSTLVVLARSPQPGVGKSRLRSVLPSADVDAVATAMVVDTLAWASVAGFDRLLVAHRGPVDGLLRRAAPAAIWLEQPEGGLGARIEAAVEGALDAPGSLAVQIGTDSPTLPASLLDAARTALRSAPACLIPADDGGWIGLGVTRRLSGALGAVPWSSPLTCRRTAQALTAAGLTPTLLASHYDVDETADLLRLAADSTAPERAPRTLAAIAPLLGMVRALQTPPGGTGGQSR